MADWLERRRELRARVLAEADRLEAQHGAGAHAAATTASRAPGPDWRFADEVRRELARRRQIRPRVNNPTERLSESHG
jgi:hypothetical protein